MPTSRNPVAERQKVEKRALQVRQSAFLKCEKQAVDKKKKINISSLIQFIPFLSKLFCAGFSDETPGKEGMGKELYENFLRFRKDRFPFCVWERPLAAVYRREGVWDGLSWAEKVLLSGQYTMANQEKRQNPYEIELPQSIIDSFARFLVPEIQKFYASDQGQKELEAWEKKYSDKSEEWSKVQR